MNVEQELKRLQAREQELLECNTRLLLELRATDRKRMVREFFTVADQKIPERPCVPDEAAVRLRLRLVAEEFTELLLACLKEPRATPWILRRAIQEIEHAVELCDINVDLPKLADATVDLDYTVEGFRIALGIDSTPLWKLVHDANLAKRGGPRRESDGKLLKPDGWSPPDIAGELERQARGR